MAGFVAARADAGDEILNVVGIRRAESKARSTTPEWGWGDAIDCAVWRPLVNWSAEDVRAIHQRHSLALNPLYALGASRVGCWPCIHAAKVEIAIVAARDPERIAEIAELERKLTAAAHERATAAGEMLKYKRSMFSYGGGGRRHHPLPIYDAVAWANSKRGEWQPASAGDGCMRHGFCETEPEEK